MLSDGTIRRLLDACVIGITPEPLPYMIQPASVDLCLGTSFVTIGRRGKRKTLVLPSTETHFPLPPGACVLATTLERITLPSHIMARVEGKSSWGRRFLMVHSTAGFIDPGFDGDITLELKNLSRQILRLPVYEPIAQISFDYLDQPAQRPYGTEGLRSKYQGQIGATEART